MSGQDGKIWYGLGIDNTQLQADANKSSRIFKGIGDTAVSEGVRMDNTYKKVTGSIAAFFTIQQAANFAKQIAVVRGEFQQLEVAFTTMLGGASKGKTMMQEAVEIAAKTPFDLKGVAQGAKQLLAYGSASQDVGKELVMLGNIAAGLSIPLGDMVYLYGTTQTQGRLFTQDLHQFMGRGIPLAEELAKQFGVTKEQIGELVTAGKVGFPEVQKALQAMTADGGKFNNLMEEQSKTITGQISNLSDSIDVMFNKLGQANEGAISYAISGAASLIENYEAVGREIGGLIIAYGAYKAAVISLATVQNTAKNLHYSYELAELSKLLPIKEASKNADIEAAVASGKLSQSKDEQVIAIRATIAAKLEELKTTAANSAAEVVAANDNLVLLQRKETAIRSEIATLGTKMSAITGVQNAELTLQLTEQKRAAINIQKTAQHNLEILQAQQLIEMGSLKELKLSKASKIEIGNKQLEIAAIKEKITAMQAEVAAAGVNVNSITAEMSAQKALTSEKAAGVVQNQFNAKVQKLNNIQNEIGASKSNLLRTAEASETANKELNSFATGVNTVSKNINTKSSTALFFANFKLTAITTKLNAAIMANPYVVAAVAIAALAYGIYKLVTAQTAAEKAQENFNEKIEDGKKKQDEFINKTNELIGVIRTETNTRYMQTKAFKELNDKYPELLKNISMEKLLLMDNLELQKLISQYTENESKKELFAGLDGATKDLATAKQALDNYVSSSSQGTGGTSILEVWRLNGNIEEAEESLKLWQEKLKEHRQIEADARPVDVKIADLSKNITLLETQLAEIQRLQEEAKKNSPFSWNLYDLQVGAINAQISAKQGELKTLKAGNDAQKEQDKNKAYWETQKQNAQNALEAMGEAKKNTKEWNTEIAKMNQANEKLKQWNFSSNTDKNGDDLKKLNQEIISNQLKLEDEKIALTEDGRKKRLALSEQELADKKATLKKEYDNTVSEYKKLKKALPEEVTTTYNQRVAVAESAKSTRDAEINKDADNDFAEHQRAITDVFLSEESKRLEAIKKRYDKEREWADAQFKGGNMTAEQRDNYKSDVDKSQQHEELESLLKEYQTYADKRKEIEDKFNSEIATMRSKNEGGKYDAQIKQAEKQKNEALSKTDFEEQKKGIDFTQLFGNLDNLTLPSQKELRNKIKAWIDTAGKELSPEDLKAVSDAFNKLDLNIADKDPFSVLKTSITDYKKAIEDIATAQVGVIASQEAYNKALAENGKDSEEAKKAAENLTAAEEKLKKAQEDRAASLAKANEAIHSVADKGRQIVGAAKDVLGIMGDLGIKVPEEIAGAIDGIGQMMDGLASIDLNKPLSIVTGGIKVIGGLVKSIASVFNGDNKKEKEIQRLQKQVDALESSYDKLGDAVNEAYSTDASKLIEQQNELLRQQKVLIQNQIEAEKSKKDTDDGKIDAWQKQIDEIDKTLSDNKRKAQDAIFGTDVKSAIDEFANAYANAWAAGEDKAKAMKGVVKNMIKGVVIEMLKSDLAPTIQKIRNEIESMLVDGVIDDYEQSRLDAIIDGATSDADKKYGWADKYLKGDEPDETREATKRGIATASQESVDENNGRLTAIQGHTFTISENMKILVNYNAKILTHLSGIETNTAYCKNLEAMKTDMTSMKTTLIEIQLKGLTLKK